MTKTRLFTALAACTLLSLVSFGASAGSLPVPQSPGGAWLVPYVIPVAESACTIKCEKQAQQCRMGCGPQVTCKQSCQSKMSACKSAC